MTGLGLAGIFCFRRDSVLAIPRPPERSSPRPSKVVLIINLNTSPGTVDHRANARGREGIQSSCFANEPTTRRTTSPSTNCSSAGKEAANVYAKTGT